MTPFAWMAFIAAGALGPPLRLLVDGAVQARTLGAFPWGTLVVNATGSLLLGFLAGLALYHGLGDTPKLLVGSGFCGTFTTFSTFSYETVRLMEEGAHREALRNITGTLVVGILSATAGIALASAL